MPCRERAALFAHWVDEYPKELREVRNITQGVMDGIFKDLNKKFKDADTKFRSSHGEDHTVSLKAIEVIFFRTCGPLCLIFLPDSCCIPTRCRLVVMLTETI